MKICSLSLLATLIFVGQLQTAQKTLSRPGSFASITTMEDDETPKFETYPQFTVNDDDIAAVTYGANDDASDDEISIATQAGQTFSIRPGRDMFSPDMTTPSVGEMGFGESYEEDDAMRAKQFAQAVDESLGKRLLDAVKEAQTSEVEAIVPGAKYRYGVLNYQDSDGRTPLMWALALWDSQDSDEIVRLLVTAGADLDIHDNQRKTILDYVKNNKRIPQEARDTLLKLGGYQE
jgi:hypothetical protein